MAGETLLNGRYRLVAQQGSGGMAVIYKAVDQALGRTVAVKILRPSLTTDPALLMRFRNEARSVANLSHPNIVTVYDVGEVRNPESSNVTSYIVMEYVEGQDLKKLIRTLGTLSVERSLNIAIQVCAGIGFAHRAGLVHADVKPQNILVTREDVVKVTDFGIAQALSDTQPGQTGDKQNVVWGSPHYFAPEQARGEKPTPASDVYAIGIVMFEMLTGRLPYMGTNQQELAMAHIRERVPLVTEFNPAVPDALSRIIFKVMSKEPSARYRMADQLGHVLTSYREQGRQQTALNPAVVTPPPAAPATVPPPAQPSVPPASRPLIIQPPPSAQSSSPQPVQNPPLQPLRPSTAEPTQKFSVAPVAPQSPAYNRPAVPSPAVDPFQQPMPQQPTGNTGRFYTQPPPYERDEEAPVGLDVVTLALAVLAFFAVACLIPLYIAVLQARGG